MAFGQERRTPLAHNCSPGSRQRGLFAADSLQLNAVGHCGGFLGPYIIGDLNSRTHSLLPGFAFIAICYLPAAFFVNRLKIQNPIQETSIRVPLTKAVAENS